MALLIFFNQLGYWLAFETMRQQVNREVRKQLEHKNELEYITIPTNWISESNDNSDKGKENDFIWVKPKKEFKYKNNMYDVSSSSQKGDSTYFLVYNDKDEKRLFQTFAFQLKENQNPFHQNKPTYPLKNFVKEALLFSEFKIAPFYGDFISTIPHSKWHFSSIEFAFAPESPPPIVFCFPITNV